MGAAAPLKAHGDDRPLSKDGIMFEEFLFRDNGEFMKEIGLGN